MTDARFLSAELTCKGNDFLTIFLHPTLTGPQLLISFFDEEGQLIREQVVFMSDIAGVRNFFEQTIAMIDSATASLGTVLN